MKKVFPASLFLLFFPLITNAQDVQTFLKNFLIFLNDRVIPFLVGIAFIFFVFNVIRFFILGSTNEEGREKAKALAIYGVAAFVFILIFWGIINMLSSSTGLDGEQAPLSDYVAGTP